MRGYSVFAGVVGVALLTSIPASAACKQADISGAWQVYATKALGQLTSCQIVVTKTGVISNSKCAIFTSDASRNVKLTKGSIKLQNAQTCNFTGAFTISGSLNNEIKSITLNLSKDSAIGFGDSASSGLFFLNLSKL
jgi:hypothetical protein